MLSAVSETMSSLRSHHQARSHSAGSEQPGSSFATLVDTNLAAAHPSEPALKPAPGKTASLPQNDNAAPPSADPANPPDTTAAAETVVAATTSAESDPAADAATIKEGKPAGVSEEHEAGTKESIVATDDSAVPVAAPVPAVQPAIPAPVAANATAAPAPTPALTPEAASDVDPIGKNAPTTATAQTIPAPQIASAASNVAAGPATGSEQPTIAAQTAAQSDLAIEQSFLAATTSTKLSSADSKDPSKTPAKSDATIGSAPNAGKAVSSEDQTEVSKVSVAAGSHAATSTASSPASADVDSKTEQNSTQSPANKGVDTPAKPEPASEHGQQTITATFAPHSLSTAGIVTRDVGATPVTTTLNVSVATTAPIPLGALGVEIASNLQSGRSRFEIRLDPAELGRIDVRLDIDKNGQVTSHLAVEKSATLELLRRDATHLERALNDAGFKTSGDGLQFSLRDQPSSGGNNGDESRRAPQRLVIEEQPSLRESAERNYGRLSGVSGGLDIRV